MSLLGETVRKIYSFEGGQVKMAEIINQRLDPADVTPQMCTWKIGETIFRVWGI